MKFIVIPLDVAVPCISCKQIFKTTNPVSIKWFLNSKFPTQFLNGWMSSDFQPFPVCKGLVKIIQLMLPTIEKNGWISGFQVEEISIFFKNTSGAPSAGPCMPGNLLAIIGSITSMLTVHLGLPWFEMRGV